MLPASPEPVPPLLLPCEPELLPEPVELEETVSLPESSLPKYHHNAAAATTATTIHINTFVFIPLKFLD